MWFQLCSVSRNYVSSLESELHIKCHSCKNRQRLCLLRVWTQHVALNHCIFDVNLLRNRNSESFSVISKRKFIFTVFRLHGNTSWTQWCKFNTGSVQTMLMCPLSHFASKNNVFHHFSVFDTQLVHNYFYSSLKSPL